MNGKMTARPTAEQSAAVTQAQIAVTDADVQEEALTIGLKQGTMLVSWIPWPWQPERQWVPIRACTLGEVESAYLNALAKLEQLKRQGDTQLFVRWERLWLLSYAIRKGVAVQLNDAGDLRKPKVDQTGEQAFSSADHLRNSMRDEEMFDQLWSCYVEHCKTAAPMTTAKRLLDQRRYAEVVTILKKKHGPIDMDGLLLEHLPDLLAYLLTLVPSDPEDSPA